ncbi:MFS transporter [Rathayibacter sp. VKM Ac-2801]|uniref:MFS transporter n=1 Tax=Rathayibacter sp. VKM Ac-2801 TaxID=2609255 RepID=UPI00131FD3F7|nr:MFS transporter [Rathayibacter sp. VKM Ac-2801]QHC71285.1 MFS transporter [Rathayibacter sp. VKM Ac-2801]
MPSPSAPSSARRWWVLVILALTQLVVVLDGTIVTIALPAAQADLGLTDVERQWVVTAYALAFGALLLLGGRIADYTGRKRTYLIGMIGFGAASAWGGLATSGTELIAARGLQGAFAALLAPAALALLTVSFPSGRERGTAFAVFGAVAGAGAAVGLVLGGLLTEFADWRWCLLVNVPVVVIGAIAGQLLVTESRAEGRNRFDVAGTITVALGLASVVYGFTLAEQGWLRIDTLGFLLVGVLLLALFVRIQARSDHPSLPLRIVADRVRGGAFLVQAIVGSVMIGSTLYLTLHLQLVLGLPPLEAGLANLPMTVTIMIVAGVAAKLLPRTGPRVLMIVGPLIAAAGLLYLSRITPDGGYLLEVLPALILLGVGMAMVFVPLQNLALTGVAAHDAGAAGATANAAMQIGGSIGLSIFTTLYAGVAGEQQSPVAFVDGYSAVFVAAAIGLVVASVVAVAMIRVKKEEFLAQAPKEAVAHLG